jgi:hypothetical protein
MSAPGNSTVPLPISSISRMLFRITRETQVGIADSETSRLERDPPFVRGTDSVLRFLDCFEPAL